MTTSLVTGIIFTVIGLVGVAAGLTNWQPLMEPARNYSFINMLGPTGKRVFYVAIGLFLFGTGIAFMVGIIQFNR